MWSDSSALHNFAVTFLLLIFAGGMFLILCFIGAGVRSIVMGY